MSVYTFKLTFRSDEDVIDISDDEIEDGPSDHRRGSTPGSNQRMAMLHGEHPHLSRPSPRTIQHLKEEEEETSDVSMNAPVRVTESPSQRSFLARPHLSRPSPRTIERLKEEEEEASDVSLNARVRTTESPSQRSSLARHQPSSAQRAGLLQSRFALRQESEASSGSTNRGREEEEDSESLFPGREV